MDSMARASSHNMGTSDPLGKNRGKRTRHVTMLSACPTAALAVHATLVTFGPESPISLA